MGQLEVSLNEWTARTKHYEMIPNLLTRKYMIQYMFRELSSLSQTAVRTREQQDQQISELWITIVAPKGGEHMGG